MRSQKKWLWDHAVYLFLGGLGGAAYLIGAYAGFKGPQWDLIARTGVTIAFPAVVVGAIFLMAGLGKPSKAFHAWKCPGTSWIARGVIYLSIFMAAAVVHLALWIWPWNVLGDAAGLRNFISVVGMVFGVAAMLYTGFLLGAARPMAFWSSGILPALFLVSALLSGMLAIILVVTLRGGTEASIMMLLTKGAFVLVIAQALLLIFHIQATHRVPEGQAAASILMKESGALFWFGVVVLAVVVPFALLLISVLTTSTGAGLIAGTICGLLGNLCLRQAILKGGVFARLKAGRFEYVVTNP